MVPAVDGHKLNFCLANKPNPQLMGLIIFDLHYDPKKNYHYNPIDFVMIIELVQLVIVSKGRVIHNSEECIDFYRRRAVVDGSRTQLYLLWGGGGA